MLLKDLAKELGVEYIGDGNCEITSVATLKNANSGSISFLANPKYKCQLEGCEATAVIVHPKIPDEIGPSSNKNYLISENPYLVYAKITQLLYSKSNCFAEISDQAIVSPDAIVGENCRIAPGVIIEAGSIIGKEVTIAAGSVIGEGVKIGDRTKIAANVSIYNDCIVGDECILHSGSVIGSDGFGFANDKGKWAKIEQIGRVVLGDKVEIGANTTIDRGAIEDTVIEEGVKLDNQIQVAHNVRIGKHTAIAGATAIAGSSEIGSFCTIAGMVGITGHLTICDNVHITAQSLVTKSITKPGVYSSSLAAEADKAWKRKMARLSMLDGLFKRVKRIEKIVSIKEISANK